MWNHHKYNLEQITVTFRVFPAVCNESWNAMIEAAGISIVYIVYMNFWVNGNMWMGQKCFQSFVRFVQTIKYNSYFWCYFRMKTKLTICQRYLCDHLSVIASPPYWHLVAALELASIMASIYLGIHIDSNCMKINGKLSQCKSNADNNSHKSNKHNLDKPFFVLVLCLRVWFRFCVVSRLFAHNSHVVLSQSVCTSIVLQGLSKWLLFNRVDYLETEPLFSNMKDETAKSLKQW